jgi:Zn-dependent protease
MGVTAFSALAMVLVEAQRSSWSFACGFVALILVHELGHGYAIRRTGLQAGWPVFIPFFGAVISLKGQVRSRDEEARIAYAGPLVGTAGGLFCAAVAVLTASRLWLSLAHVAFFLNLFNLVPISPLDGGRVAQAFSRRSWIVGAILIGTMFFVTGSPQLIVIGGLALVQGLRRKSAAPQPSEPNTALNGSLWARRYFGLCFFLAGCVYFSQRLLRG